jgi:Phosphotransferase System HPr (HPr) Family
MLVKQMVIKNKSGLHARPASLLVQTASKFKSSINIEFEGKMINAKSIISILAGGINSGAEIKLIIGGEDEEKAGQSISSLVDSCFGE